MYQHYRQLIRKGITNPSKVPGYGIRKLRTGVYKANNRLFELKYGDGEKLREKEWDNLIILDACRYDSFEEVNSQNIVGGELNSCISLGSHSREFMEENFHGEEFHDTVYVTTNPFAERIPQGAFYTVNFLFDEWDADVGTVRPQAVAEAGVEAHNQHPDKKLIVHFIQPHAPFLGPTAERVRSEFDVKGYDVHLERDIEDRRTGVSWKSLVRDGKITKTAFREAYHETLEIALHHVADLARDLDGKTVITADHGEMLFERVTPLTRREPHHPYNLHTEQLCVVPWHELPCESRREVSSDPPLGREQADESVVGQRLEALGYKNIA